MSQCEPKLYRKRQMLAKIQTGCSVKEPLSKEDGILRVEVGQDATPEVNMNERNIARKYLSMLPNVPGAIIGKMSMVSEIIGSGSLADRPECDTYLRGCGLRAIKLTMLTFALPATVQNVAKDSILVGGTSGATGRLVVPLDGTSNVAHIEVVSGLFVDTEVVSVGVTPVFTLTSAPIEDGGYSYVPRSENYELLTMRSEEDGIFKSMMNAMGTMSMSAEASGIGKFEWEFTGVVDKKALTVAVTPSTTPLQIAEGTRLATSTKIIEVLRDYDSELAGFDVLIFRNLQGVAGDTEVYTNGTDTLTIDGEPTKEYFGGMPMTDDIPFYTTVPPVLQDSKTKWGTFEPIFNSVSFDLANEIIARPNANDHKGLVSGYLTSRAPSGSVDPEMVDVSDFDFNNSWFDGDLYPLQFRFGYEVGNTTWVFLKAVQAQSVPDQDRDGIASVSYDFNATGERDDDLEIVFI